MSRFTTFQVNKKYDYPDLSISEKDYLAYLIDECDINQWQKTAFPGMLEKLRTGQPFLTERQKNSVASATQEFKLRQHIQEGYLFKGYADRTDGEVLQGKGPGIQSTKMAQANDDMDDDIPF